MISSRLPKDLSLNATTRTLAAIKQRGEAFIDLTESNPTRVGLHYPADLLTPLASPAALAYDPEPLGLRSAREAVSADFARRGRNLPFTRVALTASTSEAYALLFKLLCDPGDSLLVPSPATPCSSISPRWNRSTRGRIDSSITARGASTSMICSARSTIGRELS